MYYKSTIMDIIVKHSHKGAFPADPFKFETAKVQASDAYSKFKSVFLLTEILGFLPFLKKKSR